MSRVSALALRDRLSDRDLAILASLYDLRLLSTRQIQRIHFAAGFTSVAGATRCANRVLARLERHGLLHRLARRIGGVRRGSAGQVWQLGPAGERFLRTMHGGNRRRYVEPSESFTAHTLATAELAVQLHEAHAAGDIELVQLETEPTCWRSFVGQHGVQEWLKPDLFAVTAAGDYEDHWFLEADLASEHPPVVARKARAYQRYAATGAHQATHGLFPAVVWVVPDQARQRALTAELGADQRLQAELFRVVTVEDFAATIRRGNELGSGP
jgi:hypothetical protein